MPFPSPGDLPGPGIEPSSFALAGRFFTTEPLGIQSTFIRAGGNVKKKLPCGLDSKESACSVGHPSLSPGSVHGVAKSWTRLSDFTF